jgi:hypothetical protein
MLIRDLSVGLRPIVVVVTSADWIVATGIPRVAAENSTHSHPAPSKQTVLFDGLFRVNRTGWFKPTDRRAPGKEAAIEPD